MQKLKKGLFLWFIAFGLFTESISASVGMFEYQADWGGPGSPPQLGLYKQTGEAGYDGGRYDVKGNGDGFWGSSDEGFFLYTQLTGSQTMTGRVVWIDPNRQEWSKIGFMMREKGADSSSRFYGCMLRGASFGDRSGCERRTEQGGMSVRDDFHPPDDPESYVPADSDAAIWFRLTRIAQTARVMCEWSYDGRSWRLGHSMIMPFPETIAWGIAITNHQDNEELASAYVDNVSISPFEAVIGTRSISGPSYFQSTGFFQENDEFDVVIDLSNTSDEPMFIDIQETIPAGWTLRDISDGGIENQGTILWRDASVPPG
ncbi:MAG: hypothetical protein ACP5I1_17840, partial [Candidatus Hinthialibacter sp.]